MKIAINLLPGAKKKKRGGGLNFQLPPIKDLITEVKDPLLLGAIGAWFVGLTAVGTIWFMDKDRVTSIQPELNRLQAEYRQFQQLIQERDRQRALRDSLLVDLQALREIDGDRFVWPHILDEVTRAVPQYTWIVSIDAVATQDQILDDGTIVPAPVQISLEGRTSDLQAFTLFISRLENSPWLRDVRTGGTQTVVESQQAVTSFEVTATFDVPDSSFIRTVPLSQLQNTGG